MLSLSVTPVPTCKITIIAVFTPEGYAEYKVDHLCKTQQGAWYVVYSISESWYYPSASLWAMIFPVCTMVIGYT